MLIELVIPVMFYLGWSHLPVTVPLGPYGEERLEFFIVVIPATIQTSWDLIYAGYRMFMSVYAGS